MIEFFELREAFLATVDNFLQLYYLNSSSKSTTRDLSNVLIIFYSCITSIVAQDLRLEIYETFNRLNGLDVFYSSSTSNVGAT